MRWPQVVAKTRNETNDALANAVWLALVALAHNLPRAVGALAFAFHARATTATTVTA
ncbi:hypothetical protein G5C60_17355 [Streptomyces sp. HC44]|uniref:Uncharacterized protein n=1 Tax=Streptomyces scabichelini TaxID=2711217 RepID=A0A6G4V5E6_9ACTN|nr:hypothetical protein [Streptomyces scabichelini]NGO09318.1 hypothetical protein [Streptomyces scabichelini]